MSHETLASVADSPVQVQAASGARGDTAVDHAAAPSAMLVLALLLGLVYGPTASWLYERWTMSVWNNAHGALVLPVAVWLMWQELRPTWRSGPASSRWGWVFVLPALLLHVLDQGMQTQLLSAISFVLLLPGLSLLLLGADRTRRIAFPLAFVALMLPIPLAVTERLHLVLRNIVAAACATVVPWMGIPVMKVGTALHMPNASLLVADACSGFSTLYAAGAVALLTMYLSASTARRILVAVLFAPLAIVVNIVRVALLCVLVYNQGTDVLATSLHELSGILTFLVALPVIFWLGGPARPVAEPAA